MEANCKDLLELVNNALGIFTNGSLSECNKQFQELFNVQNTDITGKTLVDLSPEFQVDGRPSAEKISTVIRAVNNNNSHIFKWQFSKPDGSIIHCEVSLALVSASPDHVLLATISNLTAQSHLEESLRSDKIRTETILQSVQSGVLIIDIESHEIIDLNHAAEEMTGVKGSEIIGNICHKFICPNAEGNCPISDKKLQMHNAESVLIRYDGSRIPILKTVNPITLDGRECLIESFVDISALKKAEAEARAHQERFRTFFSSVNDAIFVHPLQQEGFAPFIEVNEIACKRYGYSRDEFLKLTAQDITKKTDIKKHADSAHRNKLLKTRRMFFETVHITKSGEEFPVEINSNIVEQYGKPVILAVVRDISERKQAEEDKSRIEAQYRQSQKVEAIGRLAGGVAHDLNNMLSPIIGYSELLLHNIGSNNKNEEFALQIAQAGHRARDLVRQLLAFGRKQTLEYRTIDLNDIILRFENLLRRTIREDIELEILLSEQSHTIKADTGQIEQVIMNLCVNAQDAMPEGGKLTLATSLVELEPSTLVQQSPPTAGTHVLLSIKDSGIGMEREVIDQMFEPFFSTKGEQGTGLGLSTVYGIVKQHNGDIWVDSARDKGSVFNIYLPVTSSLLLAEDGEEGMNHSPTGNENILLVEDNEQVRDLNHLILTQQGYKVQTAIDGTDALKIFATAQKPFDLLLTDVVMPGINGRQLYSQIAKKVPDIKVIYMSGYADDVIAHHGVLDDGIHFLQKPFSIDALTTKVREVIDKT